MNKKLFAAAALFSAVIWGAEAKETEPLQRADAYTLEMDSELKASPCFFPIGVLGDRKFEILPFMGLNLCEGIHTCYEYPAGKPCNYKASGNDRGTYFFCIWAAHTLYHSRNTKTHGPLKNLVGDDGRTARNHRLSYTDPKTKQYVMDAAAASVKSVVAKDSRNILLWGIDNEWEMTPDYSPESVALFRKWLEKSYEGNLEMLNRAWKSEYRSFDEAVPPKVAEYSKNPGGWLDWRRFSEENFAEFLKDYFSAIQNADPLKRPVIAKNTQCSLEMQAVAKNRVVNHELIAELTREISRGWYGIDQYGHGDRSAYEINYFYNCIRPLNPEPGRRYGVFSAENNNHAGPGWQFAQYAWRLAANGLRGIDFFVMGNFGARNDYATFSFTDPDGIRRDRFYYLSRFASMIHRTEKFWARSAPAEKAPRLAMLLPQRDVMLSGPTGVSWWDYSTNNRLSVYSRLRDAGYWVDVIPYGKLVPEHLKKYQGLVLVNAEHLSAKETGAIATYVREGGILFADMRSGNFDEHHLETGGLAEVLGVKFKGVYTGIEVSPDDLWYNTRYGNVIRGDGKILAELTTAELVNGEDVFRNAKGAWITRNAYGKGKAFWFNTRLGALRPESVGMKVVSDWFGDRMKDAGLAPAYRSPLGNTDKMRVETPLEDPDGNRLIVIAGTTNEALPPAELQIGLPANGKYGSAFWAPAESAWFEKVSFRTGKNGCTVFKMPEIKTAGVLCLFRDYAPLLGIKIEGVKNAVGNDPYTAEVTPGESFRVKVRLANPSGSRLSGGTLRLRALGDWNVSSSREIRSISAGGVEDYSFRVTVPEKSRFFKPNFVYPLVAEFIQDGKRIAVGNAVISVRLDPRNYEYLLTDNPTREHNARHFVMRTGADYSYPGMTKEDKRFRDPSGAKKNGQHGTALTDGLNGRKHAAYNMRSVDVLFDLKKDFRIVRLAVKRVNPNTSPCALEISVGRDGKKFGTPVAVSKLEWNDEKYTSVNLKPEDGRYVNVRFLFPTEKGGRVDEVEIFGRAL